MEDHDFKLEKARLLSLALEFGFDERLAMKSLDRLISLYGISHKFFFSFLPDFGLIFEPFSDFFFLSFDRKINKWFLVILNDK